MRDHGNRYPWLLGVFMIAFFCFNAIYNSFIGVYFSELGLGTRRIGMLMSATPLVTILMQPLWGFLGDRMKNRTVLLRLLALGASGAALLFGLGAGFGWLLFVMALFSALYTSIQPLGDSIILESLHHRRQPFGPVRLMGCVAFALASLAAGGALSGRTHLVVPLTSASLALVFLSTFLLPPISGKQRKRRPAGFRQLFKQKELLGLLALVTMLQITMGYFYSFYSIHFMALAGSTSALLGASYLISSLSEIPFLLFFDRLYERFGVGKLLVSAAAALLMRWLVLAVSGNLWVVMGSQLLHGWGFIVMTTTMAKHISLTVPEELRARGQMLLSILGIGVARITGSLGGGALADRVGLQNGFYAFAGVALAALIAFGPRYLRIPPLNGK